MNILIVTGNRPHCTDLCKRLSKDFNIVAVFHYDSDHVNFKQKEDERLERLSLRTSSDYSKAHKEAMSDINDTDSQLTHGYTYADKYFENDHEYGSVDQNHVHTMKDINSPDAIMKMRDYNPDVVVCHGGPKYSELFITSFPLVVNYHSGLSPIYNGSDSHLFAMSNGHPHLCGGTLMVLNNIIDGGDILGHYVPSIDLNDTPKSVFIKCVEGCYYLVHSFLSYYSEKGRYTWAPQPKKPLFYFQRADWNLTHVNKLKAFMDKQGCSDYIRKENRYAYWDKTNNSEANSALKEVLLDLIYSK